MNNKKLFISFAVSFLFIFFFEWIFHGVLLGNIYKDTSELWRPEAEMGSYFPWLAGGQLVIAVMFCLIFATCVRAHNIASGVLLGILIGGINAGTTFITYAVQPIPAKLMALWIVGCLVEMAIAGALIGLIYKPSHQSELSN